MSNDSKRERNNSIPRRTILKYAGVGFAVAALPELPGCAFDSDAPKGAPLESLGVDEEALLANATWVAVSRKEDLLVLELGLVGLEIRNKKTQAPPSGLVLEGDFYLARRGGPAYIVTIFQPQHILEEVFDEAALGHKPPGGRTPVLHRMAETSRLAFVVPNDVIAIPYELDKLLSALSSCSLNVSPSALPQSQGSAGPVAPLFGISAANDLTMSTTRAKSRLGVRAARARKALGAFSASNPDALVRQATEVVVDAIGPMIGRIVPTVPVKPSDLQTAIELPFRLQISPNSYAKWEHSPTPVKSPVSDRTELWHTRLTTPASWQMTIRALWTRDAGFDPNKWDAIGPPPPENPFYADMRPRDRQDIVHATSNYTLLDVNNKQRTKAVDVSMLMLSALGGWLDGHGKWADPKPGAGSSLVAWDHHAVMARDQKVRIVRTGFLYPYGHKAVWVEVSERKFLNASADTPYLWKREFIIVKEPLRTYDTLPDPLLRGFPFKSVRFKTIVTPNLDPKTAPASGFSKSSWALVNGKAFPFEVQAFDHDGNAHDFTTAGIWVDAEDAAAFAFSGAFLQAIWNDTNFADGERRRTDMRSQRVAFAESEDADDTSYSVVAMAHKYALFNTAPGEAPFVPQLDYADLSIDTIRGLTGSTQPTRFQYHATYKTNGFDGPNGQNKGAVFLKLDPSASKASLSFSKQSDKSGGFVAPNMDVTALSRAQGIVAGDADDFASGAFNPEKFFDAIGAKLFGVVNLFDIIKALGGDDLFKQAPKFLTQALEGAEAVFHIFDDASQFGESLKNQTTDMQAVIGALPPNPTLTPKAPPSAALSSAQAALYARVLSKAAGLGLTPVELSAQATQLASAVQGIIDAAAALATTLTKIAQIGPNTDLSALATEIINDVDNGRVALSNLQGVLKTLALPIDAGVKGQLLKICDKVIKEILPDQAAMTAFSIAVMAFVKAEEAIKDLHVKLDWSPRIQPWPNNNNAIFWPNDEHGFQLGVEMRAKASGGQPAGADVFATLTDFELRLLGEDPYIKLVFDKLAFKAGTKGKPEIDCVFRGLHFGGPLSFIETLRNIIPLDGFSDPPNIDISPEGLKANFTLPLPNIAVGVFSLENLAFSAGFEIPFIGKSLAVSFSFCSRESPFVLTVCMLGGGGFVGLTICPDGVRLLEISFEAQACLALDFGVASGSVSIAVGIYFAIEQDDVKLSGYLRIRGAVDVLGIIKASIELKMELSYESATGKVIGHASLEIEVSIFCFSVSVTIECERKFKGGNDDPTFRQLMAPDPIATFYPWEDYCDAFTPVAA